MSTIPDLHKNTRSVSRTERGEAAPMPQENLSGPTPEEVMARRRRNLAKASQVITLIFGILEILIGFRVLLELIAANPASPFAHFMYTMSGPFLAPFAGLTVTPSAEGAVLDIPALVAMAVYGVLYWIVIRVMWVIFDPAKARDAVKYDPDL